MFLLITLKSIRHYALRFSLAVVGLAVSIAALIYLLSFGEGTRNLMRKNLRAFNLQILVLPPSQSLSVQPILPRSLTDSIRALGVGKVYAILRMPYTAGFPPKAFGVVFGKDFSSSLPFVSEYNVSAGRDLRDSTRREALVGEVLARSLKLKVGDSITVGIGKYRVVGIIKAGSPLVDNAVIVPLNLLMKDMGTDRILAVAVSPPPESLKVVLRLLKERFPNYTVQTSESLMKMASSLVAIGDAVRFGLSSVALFVTTVFLFAIMAITVQERRWEFAVLRALGGTRSLVFRLVVGQSIIVSLIGWGLGTAVGWMLVVLSERVMMDRFGLSMVAMSPGMVLLALVVAVVVGLLGGLFPAVSAVRMNVREGLGR